MNDSSRVRGALPSIGVAVSLIALGVACRTLEAVSSEIEKDRDQPVEAREPELPPLPPRPLETVARLEVSGSDGEGMLQMLLAHGDEATRVRAATALGRLETAQPGARVQDRVGATAALCMALKDPSANVRAAAAFALGMRADPAAAEPLLKAWMDRSFKVRAFIVEAASRIDDAELRAEVLTALQDPALTVRIEAAVGPHRWSTEGDPEAARSVDEALIRRARATGADPELVWNILFTLQRRRSVVALPLYLAHAADEDPRARLFALKGIARIPSAELATARTRALAALRDRLVDPDWRVVCEAVDALGAHPDPLSIQQLGNALEHPSIHVRVQAALALGTFADHEELATPHLRAARKRSSNVAAAAIEAECRLLGSASDVLAELESSDRLRRAGLARGLRYVPADEAVPPLVRLSYDEDKRVAWFAVESLGAHAGPARARLHELCTSDDNGLRLGAVLALREDPSVADLPFLTQAYSSASGDIAEEVAFNALETAARIPADGVDALLETGLIHASPYVRRVALRLLRERAPARATLPANDTAVTLVSAPARGRAYRVADVVTNRGTLTFELFPDEAPRHVTNFLRLAESGAYDGLDFHRVVPDFVIQGADYRGDGNGARPFGDTALRREFTPRKFVRGSLGMPRNENPDSGGSQIFVTHRETPHLDGRYTLFGQLTGGFEVLDAIVVGDVIERVVLR